MNADSVTAVLVLGGELRDTGTDLKVLAFDKKLCHSVFFIGRVERVTELLHESDLVVHSSVSEGCPNAVLEAMAVGKPVVGTDIPGVRQALGTEVPDLCYCPAGDAQALARSIMDLLWDTRLRGRLGQANKSRIRQYFSVSGMGQAYLALIESAMRFRREGKRAESAVKYPSDSCSL